MDFIFVRHEALLIPSIQNISHTNPLPIPGGYAILYLFLLPWAGSSGNVIVPHVVTNIKVVPDVSVSVLNASISDYFA